MGEARACGYPNEACSTCESGTVPDDCLTGFGPPHCTYEACCGAHGPAEDVGPGDADAREPVAGADSNCQHCHGVRYDHTDCAPERRVRLVELRIKPGRRCCRTHGCGPDCR